MCYPTLEQYEEWKERAESLDMTVSGYMSAMIEAGGKKFGRTPAVDTTNTELRRQRDQYRRALQEERQRNEVLENQLQGTIHSDVQEFVNENPGVDETEIRQAIANKLNRRVSNVLDALLGESIVEENGCYYPPEDQ